MKRFGLFSSCLAFALSIVLLGVACNRPSKPVARIGEEWVGQAQWKVFLSELPKGTPSEVALDQLVRREVAWEQARRAQLLDGEAWQMASTQIQRSVLVRAYLDAQPGESPASEETLRNVFLPHNEERHVLHILCPTRAAAAVAQQRIKKGEAFDKVADALSTEPSLGQNHGDLGWMKRQAMAPEFGKVVFEAKAGDLCGPVQSKAGWHVILVKEVRLPTVTDFEKERPRLMREDQDRVNAPKRTLVVPALNAKYPCELDPVVLSADQTLVPAPGDAKRVAGRISGKEISLLELKGFMASSPQMHTPNAAIKTKFLNLLGEDVRIAIACEECGIAKKPEVRAAVWQALRNACYEAYGDNYIQHLKIPDQDLAAHHDRYPERFASIGAWKVNFLVAKGAPEAGNALAEATKGTPWKQLIAKFANIDSTGNWDPGFIEIATLGNVLPRPAVEALAKAPLNSVIGPIQTPDGPMLFKVLDRRAGSPLPLDKCLDQVREDYLRTHATELVEKYLGGEGRTGIKIELFPENAKS